MVSRTTLVGVPAYNTRLLADLSVPDEPTGLVIVAHMSTTNRWSPRERRLVDSLRARNLAALRLDLLTREESIMQMPERRAPLDAQVLARRLASATDWAAGQAQFAKLPHACLATGRGAAAALTAAAERPASFQALVSLDGRMEEASAVADRVRTPTLLVVSRENPELVAVNEHVLRRLRSVKQLVFVDDTTTMLAEQRSIEEAARLAWEWFSRFLGLPGSAAPTAE
jgi:hypothetical protein